MIKKILFYPLFLILFPSIGFAQVYFVALKDGYIFKEAMKSSLIVGGFYKDEILKCLFWFDKNWAHTEKGFVQKKYGKVIIGVYDPIDAWEKAQKEIKEEKQLEKNISNFSSNIQNLIKQGEIQIGMTGEQVLLSWGHPDRINKSVYSWGIHEQWVYGYTYLYFEDGILKSYQTSK